MVVNTLKSRVLIKEGRKCVELKLIKNQRDREGVESSKSKSLWRSFSGRSEG